ncbi:hypothetical protein [Burkholderia mayonis]|uniref:Uncharacterized protein n=1 Tax=Burkholderia mayonis TaxID=1385591 RepID=A0A1B4G2N5_9BURK|nr:hypothetical protein [Burkholderia mayonis]AOJ10133.1 hypothetical protein WS71_23130 [Burkholderia mayonis]
MKRNSEDYQTLCGASVPANAAPSRAQDTRAANMLSNIAWNVTSKVVERLIIEVLPLSQEIKGAKEFYEELRSIYTGNYTPQGRLDAFIDSLERLGAKLTRGGTTSNEAVLAMKGYLDVVTPWLRSASTHWRSVELGIEEVRNAESMLSKVQNVLQLTESMLADPRLTKAVNADTLSGLGQSVGAIRQTLSQLQMWQALPGEARLEDYLRMAAANPLAKEVLGESVQQLGLVLANALKDLPYPSGGTLAAKLTWLAGVLSNPALRERVRPHLEMVLGESQADRLVAIFQFTGQLQQFPANSSLTAQALWLCSTLGSNLNDMPVLPWLNHFQSALGADPATVSLMNRLLTLDKSQASRLSLIKDLAMSVAPTLGEMAAGQVAKQFLPAEVVRELEKFYKESSATESWASMAGRAANGAWALAKPYAAGLATALVTGDPQTAALVPVTVSAAEALQRHTSLEETLQWFVAQDPSQDKQLQFLHSQYLNARLLWEVYQAWNSTSPAEAEDKLQALTRQLKDYEVVKHYPLLAKMIDLIELLPALRDAQQTVGAQPSADSWLDWGQQWLDALADSTSPHLIKLRENVSSKLENWVADAAMSAIQAVVERPWGLLPGAAAASIPQEATAASSAAAAESANGAASSSATSGGRANWQLPGGIGLVALGGFAIAYAAWQLRQAGKPEPVHDIEMQELVRRESTVAQPQDGTDALLPAGSTGASTVAHTSKPAEFHSELPLLPLLPLMVGVVGVAGGGKLIYDWATSGTRAAAESTLSESEYQEQLKIIRELRVPSLDFLFYDEQNETNEAPENRATIAHQAGEPTTAADEKFPTEQQMGRSKRSIAADRNPMRERINEIANEVRLRGDRVIAPLLKKVDEAVDKINVRIEHLGVVYLLTCIEHFSAYIDRLTKLTGLGTRVKPDVRVQKFRQLISRMWKIADQFNLEYEQSAIQEYKRVFLINFGSAHPLPSEDTATVTSAARPTTTGTPTGEASLTPEIVRVGKKILYKIEKAYSPILNPSEFIDNFIKNKIQDFNNKNNKDFPLDPEMKIVVIFKRRELNTNRAPGDGKFAMREFERKEYSLRNLVMGYDYYKDTRAFTTHTNKEFVIDDPGERDLVDACRNENDLQALMMGALSEYRTNSENRSILESHYRDMIKLRCLQYLSGQDAVPLYKEAVEKFFNGEIQAKEVLLKGAKLNGVFFIPSGEAGGVLFSVDEPKFFHVGRHIQRNGEQTFAFPAFPNVDEFKEWVFNKIPSYKSREYEGIELKAKPEWLFLGAGSAPPLLKHMVSPIEFRKTESQSDLAGKLFDGLMERVNSDIDYLVLSDDELADTVMLEKVKSILTFGALAVNFAVPSTGTVMGRVAQFLVNLAIDAAYVGATVTQAQMADRPEDAAAYRNEAIIAGVLGGVGAAGAPLVTRGVKRALARYRQIKQEMDSAMPQLLKTLNWEKLQHGRKINQLVDALKNSDDALELHRLTGSSDTVEQSIRRGRQDPKFSWRNYDSELESARGRLKDDLRTHKHDQAPPRQQVPEQQQVPPQQQVPQERLQKQPPPQNQPGVPPPPPLPRNQPGVPPPNQPGVPPPPPPPNQPGVPSPLPRNQPGVPPPPPRNQPGVPPPPPPPNQPGVPSPLPRNQPGVPPPQLSGPIEPSRPQRISVRRADELIEGANKVPLSVETPAVPKDLSNIESKYFNEIFQYRKMKAIWDPNLKAGTKKYKQFYEEVGTPASEQAKYRRRYVEKVETNSSDAPYVDAAGNVRRPEASVVALTVKDNKYVVYRFRFSKNGNVFVVDNMYGNLDDAAIGTDIGKRLPMNEVQGEFIISRQNLRENINYITQENVANEETQNLLNAAFGKFNVMNSSKNPIVLTPNDPTGSAFRAMLNTPNVQPTARMLSTYPEIGKKIVEIRIQGYDRITLVLGER